MKRRRKGRALRKRYGRSWPAESALILPGRGDTFDVILVDSRGTQLRPLARGVTRQKAYEIVRQRHP